MHECTKSLVRQHRKDIDYAHHFSNASCLDGDHSRYSGASVLGPDLTACFGKAMRALSERFHIVSHKGQTGYTQFAFLPSP